MDKLLSCWTSSYKNLDKNQQMQNEHKKLKEQ